MKYLSKLSTLTLITLTGTNLSLSANAQENESDWHGFASLMTGYAPDFEGSDHNKIIPYGSIHIRNGNYYFQTEGAGFVANIWDNDTGLIIGPAINFRLERNDNVNNQIIKKLTKVKSALEVGGFIGYATNIANDWDEFEIRVKGLYDINNSHSGYIIESSISYRTPISEKIMLGASLTTSYADENYQQIYFGINQIDAALSGLSQYNADAGLKDVTFSMNANYRFYQNWGLFGVVSYTKLLNDAKKSPIILNAGNGNGYFAALGISYQF